MRSCRASRLARRVVLPVLLLGACAGPRVESLAERAPLEYEAVRAPALPDDQERAVARFAALVLANQPDSAAAVLAELNAEELRRAELGRPPSGLLDNAYALFETQVGSAHFAPRAEALLEREDLDPVLRRRLEVYLASRPLEVARRRLAEDRRSKLAAVVNRIIRPLSRFALGATLNPIETGRAALASLLVMRSVPDVTTRERQALRAYQDYLERNPDPAVAPSVIEWVEDHQQEWLRHLHDEAVEVAQRALDAGQPETALLHIERAERLLPAYGEAPELRARARQAIELRDARIERSLHARDVVGLPPGDPARADLGELAAAVLIAPLPEVARRAEAWGPRVGDGPLADELRFLAAYGPRGRGDESGFFEALGVVARLEPPESNMARYARAALADPEQNPYAFYRKARTTERRQRTRALLLGSRMHGALRRDLPRPLEYLLDLPGIVVSFVTFPLRLLDYPRLRTRFIGPVLYSGEQYLARFEEGEHAEEVHRELETLYTYRTEWSQALAHHRARSDADPARIASYRERIAERLLEAAGAQRRVDVRVSLYRSVIDEYGDTEHAETARRELSKLLAEHTPQQVRLTRAFLQEHPSLWGSDALGLRPELLDGDEDNGEIDEEGITLVGLNLVRISRVGREPVVKEVPADRFRRFIALLEQVEYRALATDPRERPVPDPQGDLFFERARLGLLQDADLRPSAASEAVFESTQEKFGMVRRRESILPVELVLQGGLEDFAFSAFPRIRQPGETPDAFLYR